MKDRKYLSAVILLSTLIILLLAKSTLSCNRSLCASQVSKCLLTQSCKCEMKGSKNCTCCKDCLTCLSWLWEECCSCVDLCPKVEKQSKSPLSKKSHYEELEGIPGLFDVLLEDEDEKWSVFTFPVDYDSSLYGSKSQESFFMNSADHDLQNVKDLSTVTYNCSVTYHSNCMSMTKCRETCESMGASSYRWFFDGCCECIGSKCLNHGIDESRCSECPETKINEGSNNSVEPPPNEEDLDYGEGSKSL